MRGLAGFSDGLITLLATVGVARLPGMGWSLHGSGGRTIALLLLVGAVLYIPSSTLTGRTIGRLVFRVRLVPLSGGRLLNPIRVSVRYLFAYAFAFGKLLPESGKRWLGLLRSRASQTLVVSNGVWSALSELPRDERAQLLRQMLVDIEDAWEVDRDDDFLENVAAFERYLERYREALAAREARDSRYAAAAAHRN